MKINSTNQFDGKGTIYSQGRPSYAEALFEYMESDLKFSQTVAYLARAEAFL